MDQSRSLPSPRGVRQSSFTVSELATALSTTLMLPPVAAQASPRTPCVTPTALGAPGDQCPATTGTWFVMDVAQGPTFGRHVAQVHRLVDDLDLSVRERRRR